MTLGQTFVTVFYFGLAWKVCSRKDTFKRNIMEQNLGVFDTPIDSNGWDTLRVQELQNHLLYIDTYVTYPPNLPTHLT